MKATKFIILALGAVLSIVLPVVDILMNLSDGWSSDTKFQIVVGLGILLATLVATYISIVDERISKIDAIESVRNEGTVSRMNYLAEIIKDDRSLCYALNKKDLYSKLSELVNAATERLELMYLGLKPPSKLEKFPIRDKYISDLEKVINDEKFQVKRIILFNAANKAWIKQIANKFKTKRFFSLYIIETNSLPLLSIQVIDDDKVVVINGAANATLDKKHIFFDSADLNLVFHGFYRNILETSIPIIVNGELDKENFKKYLC